MGVCDVWEPIDLSSVVNESTWFLTLCHRPGQSVYLLGLLATHDECRCELLVRSLERLEGGLVTAV